MIGAVFADAQALIIDDDDDDDDESGKKKKKKKTKQQLGDSALLNLSRTT